MKKKIGSMKTRTIVFLLAAAIIVGVVVYAALVVLTRAITRDDLLHIPKGDKLAKLLRVK